MSLISLQNVSKTLVLNNVSYKIFKKVNLEVKKGESISIIGPSGSGKSSLLKIIGLLDVPTSGSIFIDGKDCATCCEKRQTHLRRKFIGFVFQSYNLLPDFTALENILLPQNILGTHHENANSRAQSLLKELHLEGKSNHYPNELSGGEQQRVSIARSLINNPKIVLADEPTGNLDSENTNNISKIFATISKRYKIASIIVTHDIVIAKNADKIYSLNNSKLELKI